MNQRDNDFMNSVTLPYFYFSCRYADVAKQLNKLRKEFSLVIISIDDLPQKDGSLWKGLLLEVFLLKPEQS